MNDIIRDPRYLAYKFNFNTESVEYLEVNSEEIRWAPWLRHTDIAPERPLFSVPLTKVIEQSVSEKSSAPPAFIFHTAYCASTYLSRCLDLPGHSLSLREPQLLLDAANAKRLNWASQTTSINHEKLPSLFLSLLLKQGYQNEQLVLKPINSINNIIPELLQASPESKAVMLYTDARNFMLSALKKGEPARQTLRSMFDLLRCDFPQLANLTISDAIHMSDLKLMLTFWRLQLQQAEAALQLLSGGNRMASVYAEDLIAKPYDGLIQVNKFLNTGLQEEQLFEIARGSVSKRDAKNPEKSFSASKRDKRYAELEKIFGEDLNNGLNWMKANNPRVSLTPSLTSSLTF